MSFPGPGDRRGHGDLSWSAWNGRPGQELPFHPTPRPQSDAPRGHAPRATPERPGPSALDPCVLVLRAVRLPRQVSAFSHQLAERWALECCSQAPWPRSTWRFTHPFPNLILHHFIPLPTQCLLKSLLPTRRSTGPGLPGLPGECSHNWASRQSREHRLPPWRLQHPATHSGVKDPSHHLGGGRCPQGQENCQAMSEEEGLFLWGLQIIKKKKNLAGKGRERTWVALLFVYKAGASSQGTSANPCSIL